MDFRKFRSLSPKPFRKILLPTFAHMYCGRTMKKVRTAVLEIQLENWITAQLL